MLCTQAILLPVDFILDLSLKPAIIDIYVLQIDGRLLASEFLHVSYNVNVPFTWIF